MNHKRSRNSNKSRSPGKGDRLAELATEISEPLANIPQSTPLHQPLWFWLQHSRWSYFGRGLFWGGLVSSISVFSAIGGIALTTIDVVEQQISRQLKGNFLGTNASSPILTTPWQILLVEVEPDADALVGFSPTSSGKSKNILLLELQPEQNFARVLTIPGDSRLEIPGFGVGTVNDAYRVGGIDALSRSLEGADEKIAIDRYLRTSPEVFRQLIDSGKINLADCDSRLQDCLDLDERIVRQQTVLKTIRQRLNIPGYYASFQNAIAEAEPQLDTNLSNRELISVANFIKELEPDRLTVKLLPDYTPAVAPGTVANSPRNDSQFSDRSASGLDTGASSYIQNRPVAVQNTTDDPELGRRVVAYLRSRNFRDVYLVRHIPLKLEQTRIVTNYGQVETANYLKNVLGFGNLEAKSRPQQQLMLQLGEDALYLPQS